MKRGIKRTVGQTRGVKEVGNMGDDGGGRGTIFRRTQKFQSQILSNKNDNIG